ncbi:MAG: AMP-binding protein, partial [Mycobacteriaceae bacterium]
DTEDALTELHAHPAAPLAPVPLGRPMHFTSGTTGRRKGVSSGVLDVVAARALWEEEATLWRFSPSDTHVVVSPLYHSAPLRFAISTLLAGGTVLVPGPFSPQRFLDVCATHHPTTMFSAPAQLQRLREHGGAEQALTGFRLIAHAGAPCPEPVKRWLLKHTGPDVVWEFYGCTEGQLTACSATDWLAHPGTVGRARPGRRLAVDPDGSIWCAVPEHARFSYWGAPEKTTAAWRGDEFTVGDLGRLDPEGWLYLDGRRDDLVLSGGVNVYPLEVERILSSCPGVREVMVRGVPDDRWGQRVEAVVVGAPELELAGLDAYARTHLTPAQRPKSMHLVDALPRNSAGKVLRRE